MSVERNKRELTNCRFRERRCEMKTCGTCKNRKSCREFGIYGPLGNYAERCNKYKVYKTDKGCIREKVE